MLSGGSNGAVDKITLTRQSFSSLPFPKAAQANFLLHYRYYPMIIHPAVVGMVMLPNLCIGRMKVSGSAVAQTLTANGAPKMMTDRQSPKGCSSIWASISGLGNMHHRHCWVQYRWEEVVQSFLLLCREFKYLLINKFLLPRCQFRLVKYIWDI